MTGRIPTTVAPRIFGGRYRALKPDVRGPNATGTVWPGGVDDWRGRELCLPARNRSLRYENAPSKR